MIGRSSNVEINRLGYFSTFIWVQVIGIFHFIGAFFFETYYATAVGRASISALALGIPIYFLGKNMADDNFKFRINLNFLFRSILIGISIFICFKFIDLILDLVELRALMYKYSEAFWSYEKVNHWLSILLISPFLEEILFRAILFNQLEKKYPFWSSSLFVSLVFTLAHIGTGIDLLYHLKLFGLSLALCYFYRNTRNVLFVVLIHFSYNFSFYLFKYVTIDFF